MSDDDRMAVMKALKMGLVTHACPKCSTPLYCAVDAGKSGSTCWCMTVPIKDKPDIYEESKCLCKKCLTE